MNISWTKIKIEPAADDRSICFPGAPATESTQRLCTSNMCRIEACRIAHAHKMNLPSLVIQKKELQVCGLQFFVHQSCSLHRKAISATF